MASRTRAYASSRSSGVAGSFSGSYIARRSWGQAARAGKLARSPAVHARELPAERDEPPALVPELPVLLEVAVDEVARPEPAADPARRGAPANVDRELERRDPDARHGVEHGGRHGVGEEQ